MKEKDKKRKKRSEVLKELLKKNLNNLNRRPVRNPASQTKTIA